jgi:putative FmdB family regulatory protein
MNSLYLKNYAYSERKEMPTYHYRCEKCHHEFEIEQRITAPPRKRCPRCSGPIYRVIHPVGHILKGSGFYRTDYRGEEFKKRETAETVKSGKDRTGGEKKTGQSGGNDSA